MGKRGEKAADEVEQLLRAAEDELLLNLSTNTHTISNPNPNPLDPDLARRFDALKRKPTVQPQPDDLSARLAALKGASGTSGDDGGLCRGGEGESVEDVMRWAMDVARLEPSSSVSSEEDEDDDEEEDEEDGGGKRKMKEEEKKKGVVEEKEKVKDGKKKWYFF